MNSNWLIKQQFNKNINHYLVISNNKTAKLPDDFLVKLFYAAFGVLGIYILISMMKRIKERK